jgi:hypothetical protein
LLKNKVELFTVNSLYIKRKHDYKYPNDIKESEKRRIRKMSYKFVIEESDLFYLKKDKLSDNMVKRLVITKDKLSTVLIISFFVRQSLILFSNI